MRSLCEHAFCGQLRERLDDDAEMAAHKAETRDYQRGYEVGRDDALRALAQRDMVNEPPWLRRFFWHPLETYCEDSVPRLWVSPRTAATDEWCNPVFGIRMRGGVLYVRYKRRVRLPLAGMCPVCVFEEAEFERERQEGP